MRSFAELYERAAARKGGPKPLEALIPKPKTKAALRRVPDDRWLSEMTKSVFQAGFVWRVVENRWPDFEAAFQGFDPHAVAYLSDEDIEKLVGDPKIIRHHKKVLSTRANATFMLDLAAEHGSAAQFFADSPAADYVGLLEVLKKRASRMGGSSAQYFLRRMGKDAFVLSRDVVKVLIAEGVVTKSPSAKRDMAAVQQAFNTWCDESGRNLTTVSRVLAMSTD